jgi:hypothetical protein
MTIRKKIYLLFLFIGITNVVFSPCLIDKVLNNTISKTEIPSSNPAEEEDLTYNLYLPFDSGSMLTGKVEQIFTSKITINEKILLLFSSICKKYKSIKYITQYTNVLMQSQQLTTTAIFNSIFQI